MYGNVNASDEEIMNATKSAYIYDKCVSFPSQYETQVNWTDLTAFHAPCFIQPQNMNL